MRFTKVVAALAVLAGSCGIALTQDATVAAPDHYKIEFENELVRVVRVTYAPHEKSAMHEHQGNPTIIVALKGGGRMHFLYPDGTTSEGKAENAGTVRFVPARPPFKHAGENVADVPLEVLRVELKTAAQSTACATK